MTSLAISNGDVILLILTVAIPVVAISYLGAGAAYREIGKGPFAIDEDVPEKGGGGSAPVSAETRKAELRQLLEAKAFRQTARGDEPLDVEAELERLLAESPAGGSLRADTQLVSEVRDMVEASNARRLRMGREPLDVDAEVERQLTELESLGQ